MNETIDHLIQTRFDRVANLYDNRDWEDVRARTARSKPTRPRRAPLRLAVVAAAAALTATLTAAAFGWPRTFVDFFKAPAAPESVGHFFSAFKTAVPHGVSPDTKLGQPREIMAAIFDADNLPPTHPILHTLYVAPRADGGFCYVWTDFGGGCADPEVAAKSTTDPAARPLGLDWLENDYVGLVDGWVRTDAKTVEARFADGTTAPIPVTWVSAPIDAGFFVYVVPDAHLTRADALSSVVALDGTGSAVSTQPFALTKPLDQDVMQTLPDGTKLMLPRRAQADRAKEIFSFRAANSGHAYLWVMPRTGGGSCYLYSTGAGGGQGCASPYWAARLPAVNSGGTGGVYFAQVKPGVAAVELRFGNGKSERLSPIDGFVLHEIGDAQLVDVIGLDRSGKAVFTQRVRR
jgi:hypothetical protein